MTLGFLNAKEQSISSPEDFNNYLNDNKYVDFHAVVYRAFTDRHLEVEKYVFRIFKVPGNITMYINMPSVREYKREIKVKRFDPSDFGVGGNNNFSPHMMNLLFLKKEEANRYYDYLKSDLFKKELISWSAEQEIDHCRLDFERNRREEIANAAVHRNRNHIPAQFHQNNREQGEDELRPVPHLIILNPPRPTPRPKPPECSGFFDDDVFGSLLIGAGGSIFLLICLIFYLHYG